MAATPIYRSKKEECSQSVPGCTHFEFSMLVVITKPYQIIQAGDGIQPRGDSVQEPDRSVFAETHALRPAWGVHHEIADSCQHRSSLSKEGHPCRNERPSGGKPSESRAARDLDHVTEAPSIRPPPSSQSLDTWDSSCPPFPGPVPANPMSKSKPLHCEPHVQWNIFGPHQAAFQSVDTCQDQE